MPLPNFDDLDSELIKVAARVVKKCYEAGKKTGDGNYHITMNDLEIRYRQLYGEDPTDEMGALQDLADCMDTAWQLGAKDSIRR